MTTDPFSWAKEFAAQSNSRAAQDYNDAQQSLMAMFRTEAARQAPWADLPLDLAKMNARADRSMQDFYKRASFNEGLVRSRPGKAVPSTKIAKIIKDVAKMYGEDADFLITMAELESTFNPLAQNKDSSAGGLFQQTDANAKDYNVVDRFDPVQSTEGAARFARANRAYLRKVLGRDPTPGELYLAHQQGPAGAAKLLSNPTAPAESIVGVKAVRLNGGRMGMSAQQFANLWINKFNRAYNPRRAQSEASKKKGNDANTLIFNGKQYSLNQPQIQTEEDDEDGSDEG